MGSEVKPTRGADFTLSTEHCRGAELISVRTRLDATRMHAAVTSRSQLGEDGRVEQYLQVTKSSVLH